MQTYWLGSVLDHVLLQNLKSIAARDRATTAELLAHLAEVEARGLYRGAGYPSMKAYCIRDLRMSEDEALKRIRVARAGRQLPAIFPALAEGRLTMTGGLLLAPYVECEAAGELLTSAMDRTKAEIELLIAERFPRDDVPTRLGPFGTSTCGDEVAPEPPLAGTADPHGRSSGGSEVAPEPPAGTAQTADLSSLLGPVGPSALPPMNAPRYPRIAPLSADRDAFQCTFRRETSELLRYAQALLSHTVPSGDLAEVIHRCLAVAVEQIEKRRFGVGSRSQSQRRTKRGATAPRAIPMHVRREVYERDGGRCTFTSDSGHRCEATHLLQFDHIVPEARGGESTVPNLRLRCRAHNQLAAEQAFGAGTMREKREAARARAEEARSRKLAEAAAAPTPPIAPELDVTPWLRSLRFSVAEARRGAELCAHMPDAPLEARVRFAIAALAPPSARPVVPFARSSA